MVVQWGGSNVFKVGGKMFAWSSGSGPLTVSFKVSEDSYEILCQQPGMRPAPYLARAKWVRLDRIDALGDAEIEAYLARAHALIVAKLPRAVRARLA